MVIDATGRVVHVQRLLSKASQHKFDISSLPVGLYNLLVIDDQQLMQQARFIIEK
jgi:hypothetical protein